MAGGGEEMRLGDIGLVRLGLGASQRGVEAGEFLGALPHAPLQGLVGALQGLGGLDARSDVGERRHQAAVRHAIGAHLHDKTAIAFEDRSNPGYVSRDALGDQFFEAVAAELVALGVEADDFVESGSNPDQVRRQVQDLAETPIPADQVQTLVEHGDALADVIERRLQDLAIVLDRRVGVVEQLERRLGRDRALAQ